MKRFEDLIKKIQDLRNDMSELAKTMMDKSNYGPDELAFDLYDHKDNARRKMGRTGERHELGPNSAIKQAGLSAKGQAEQEATRDKKRSKANPVKVFSDKEKQQLASQLKNERPDLKIKIRKPKKKKKA